MQQQKIHYQIQGETIILKPYKQEYVSQYHSWFVKDPELLYLTGSEPLTLQEEYENHRSWVEDMTKYTFIVFDKGNKMIGDVNLFFSKWIEPHQAEINIMIAPKQQRGKGYARETLKLIQAFARIYYNKTQINAKIKSDNQSSNKLFSTSNYTLINHNIHFSQNQYIKKLQQPLQTYKQLLQKITIIDGCQLYK